MVLSLPPAPTPSPACVTVAGSPRLVPGAAPAIPLLSIADIRAQFGLSDRGLATLQRRGVLPPSADGVSIAGTMEAVEAVVRALVPWDEPAVTATLGCPDVAATAQLVRLGIVDVVSVGGRLCVFGVQPATSQGAVWVATCPRFDAFLPALDAIGVTDLDGARDIGVVTFRADGEWHVALGLIDAEVFPDDAVAPEWLPPFGPDSDLNAIDAAAF